MRAPASPPNVVGLPEAREPDTPSTYLYADSTIRTAEISNRTFLP